MRGQVAVGRWLRLTVMGLLLCVVAACSSSGGGGGDSASGTGGAGGSDAPSSAAKAPAQVQTNPADGAADVGPATPVSVTVAHGTIQTVGLTNPDGVAVTGAPAPAGTSWTTTEPLGYGKTYTWDGTAVGEDGKTVSIKGSFTTVTPASEVHAQLNIGDNSQVGIAAPIIVQFDAPIADKAAVEKAMTVQTSVPTNGSWAWLPDGAEGSRAHWRPEQYWAPGTAVNVSLKLYGVAYGDGAYGQDDVTSSFTIGRSQIVKADVNSFRMVVVQDGQVVFDFPASYGLASDPNRVTRNGTHIVMEKHDVFYMSNPDYGYVNLPEHWSVRISNNGEFIHANPGTTNVQGSENVTHGCVNLSEADAQAYYDTALYGDPVEVTGSSVPMTAQDGDVYDWAVDWPTWVSMSALN